MSARPSTARAIAARLQRYESRNVTYFEPGKGETLVWERARGVHVWGVDGRKYLDLTAAFGVAAAGHANPRVVRAGQRQMAILLHAMGDVYPHALKADLARELSRLTFERWSRRPARRRESVDLHGKTLFANSGFEAVEAALKTALLATGRRGVIAFAGGYHGLGYGALNATHRAHFRAPFASQLGKFGQFVPFPERGAELAAVERGVRRALAAGPVGAILVEPIQARGGIRVPPRGFLPLLRRLCDESGALLILDEIYTGFGRTGRWFACEHAGVVPDIICLGKALTGGFPLSACVGRADVMDRAWPLSSGEAIHTSTFLGHPVGCAMALAQIREIARADLVRRSARVGRQCLKLLRRSLARPRGLTAKARGLGLMLGVELRDRRGAPATAVTLQLMRALLELGFITLPEGEHSNVLGFTPPLTLTVGEFSRLARALPQALERASREAMDEKP